MKIVLCHNYYQCRGGEDVSFEVDVQMLRDYGHDVATLTRDNATLNGSSRLRAAKHAVWNAETEAEARDLIRDFQPDILHCNNLFPQISPSVYRAANQAGVPVVQAIRNYRYFCPSATMYRDGRVCTDCLRKPIAYPAVLHACYRDSRAASAVVAGMHAFHRATGTWRSRVDAFFTPSQFAKNICVEAGIAEDQIRVRTNFIFPDLGPGDGGGGFALFVGRLSREKGTETLADAWDHHNPQLPLKIVGGGESERLARLAERNPRVELLGFQPQEQVLELVGQANCLLFTSRWYETFGRTIAEAFSRGTPVVSSRLGVMADHIRDGENGLFFPAGDAAALAACVDRIAKDPPGAKRMRERARQDYLKSFTRQQSYDQLVGVYETAAKATGVFESGNASTDVV